MAVTKEKKQEITKKVNDILANSESVVFVNFHKLPIGDEQAMRNKLKDEGVGYYVARKTLVRRALADTTVAGDLPELEGELAIAYSADAVAPAREVQEFAKAHKEQVAIMGGIFEGAYKSGDEMRVIAAIPGMQTLRGMFVNVINSPIQGLAVALNAIAEKKETA